MEKQQTSPHTCPENFLKNRNDAGDIAVIVSRNHCTLATLEMKKAFEFKGVDPGYFNDRAYRVTAITRDQWNDKDIFWKKPADMQIW